MSVTISDEVLQSAHLTADELRQEVAIMLFQKERLTLAQAARLAEMSRWRFQALLASREIPIHYDVEEFEQDLQTIRELKDS
jgi:predicted HTH domain antitoxin